MVSALTKPDGSARSPGGFLDNHVIPGRQRWASKRALSTISLGPEGTGACDEAYPGRLAHPICKVAAADSAERLPAKSVVRAVKVRVPLGTVSVLDQVPLLAATVPREAPFSNTSTVVPASALPESVNVVGALPDGAVITGAAGACESIWITRTAELGEVPPRLRALAVNKYAPSLETVTVRVQVPDALVLVVPSDELSAKTSTVAPVWAVPDRVSVRLRVQL